MKVAKPIIVAIFLSASFVTQTFADSITPLLKGAAAGTKQAELVVNYPWALVGILAATVLLAVVIGDSTQKSSTSTGSSH